MTKKPKTRQKGDSAAIAMRNAHIIAQAAAGKRVNDIAKEIDVDRRTVSAVLNSDEQRLAIKNATGRLAGLLDASLDALEDAITQRADIGTAARTAAQVLKNFRVLRDAPVEIEGKIAGLFVIHRPDGTEVIMGAKREDDDDGN